MATSQSVEKEDSQSAISTNSSCTCLTRTPAPADSPSATSTLYPTAKNSQSTLTRSDSTADWTAWPVDKDLISPSQAVCVSKTVLFVSTGAAVAVVVGLLTIVIILARQQKEKRINKPERQDSDMGFSSSVYENKYFPGEMAENYTLPRKDSTPSRFVDFGIDQQRHPSFLLTSSVAGLLPNGRDEAKLSACNSYCSEQDLAKSNGNELQQESAYDLAYGKVCKMYEPSLPAAFIFNEPTYSECNYRNDLKNTSSSS